MCTVTWRFDEHGFDLLSNRDERRSRAAAMPPRMISNSEVRWLAPIDAEAGGTWIGANEYGFALCLLNLYPTAGSATSATVSNPHRDLALVARSRGLLVADLLGSDGSGDIESKEQQLRASELSRYQPFTLLGLAPGAQEKVWQWDGARLEVLRPRYRLLSSSGHDAAAAEAARTSLYVATVVKDGEPSRDGLLGFHRSHDPARGPLSPCMHRPEAATVSLTHVRVDQSRVLVRYEDRSPCREVTVETLDLVRAEASGVR